VEIMGIDVVLVEYSQRGTSPRRRSATTVKVVGDPDSVFANILDRVKPRGQTPLVDRIYPYGTRELAYSDMPQFISELEGIDHSSLSEPERLVLAQVLSLAAECLPQPGFGLRLEGD
jgi:hypothetical protein